MILTLKKYHVELGKIFDSYSKIKNEFLNYIRIIDYNFCKPLKMINNISDILNVDCDTDIPIIRLRNCEKNYISDTLSNLIALKININY